MSTNIITHAAESGENSRGQLSARGGISFYHFFNISSVVCDALIQPCIEFIGTELKWSEGGGGRSVVCHLDGVILHMH